MASAAAISPTIVSIPTTANSATAAATNAT
jgi:hypothetical protein